MTLTHSSKFLAIFLCLCLCSCTKVQKKPTSQFSITSERTTAGAIAPTSGLVALSSLTSGIYIWDITQQQLKFRLHQQKSAENLVTQLVFSPDGQYLLSADSRHFALWRMSDGNNLGYWSLHTLDATIRSIAVSDQGKHLLIGQSDGKVQHITLKSGRRLEFLGHQENINSVTLSPNGKYALTGSSDLHSYLWDTQSAQIQLSIPHANRVTMVALDPQGRYAFSADNQNLAQIYDLKTAKLARSLPLDRGRTFTAARFSPDGQYLLTGAPSRRVTIWSIHTAKEPQDWLITAEENTKPASAVVYDLALMSNQQVMTLSSAGLLEFWEWQP